MVCGLSSSTEGGGGGHASGGKTEKCMHVCGGTRLLLRIHAAGFLAQTS